MTKKNYLLSAFLFLSCVFNSFGQVEKMEAAFIYNFASLVNWPSSYQSGDFVIAVLGSAPITKELEDIAKQKKAGAQTITVKKISSPSEIGNAHIVFIPDSQKGKIADVVGQTGQNSTLVISESAGGAAKGSIINFILVDEKLRFELNEGKATAKSLKLAPTLVKLGIPLK
jgi:hypothetical protein